MAGNQTIRDLKVKQLILEWRTGSGGWTSPGQPIFTVGTDYRLSVIFGNTLGDVEYPGDRYDKTDIRIALSPLGIKTSSGYIHRDALQFYNGASFSSGVSSPPEIHIAGPFKTTHADLLNYLYLRATPPIQSFPLNKFRFVAVISAAIRNQRSHQVTTEVG